MQRVATIATLLIAVILALSGVALLIGGLILLFAGGSAYYAPSGLALLATAWLLLRRRSSAAVVYGAFALISALWAVWEVGFDSWALMPRLVAITIFLIALAAVLPWLGKGRENRTLPWLALGVPAATIAGVTIGALDAAPFGQVSSQSKRYIAALAPTAQTSAFDARNHFSPAAQITPANVSKLNVAWQFHTGDVVKAPDFGGFEATPVHVDDRIYFCTPHSQAIALAAETGREIWRYDARPDPAPGSFAVCRGVTHYRTEADADGRCRERIAYGTRDFRLIALDAQDGKPCAGFGIAGSVSLNKGFPRLPKGSVMMTSPPSFINGLLVVGHFVMDNQRTDAPPGVVRAYDGRTGIFQWAWDMGRPGVTGEPAGGQTYSLGRPNAWAGFTADPQTGLVFVPTGNPGSDFFSATRSPDMLKYGSSIVALDASTGLPRWSFQTVHRDVWDYDLPSAPALIDFPTAQGRVAALIQATKTGQIFVLRRSDGTPLVPVEERSVPTEAAPGEILSSTQPFSTMPNLAGDELTEADAWGLTPIDQMLCRLSFRRAHYAGQFTAIQTKPTLYYPGFSGGSDWGGVAVDRVRDLLIVTTSRMANYSQLIPHDGPVVAQGDPGHDLPYVAPYPQKGTPYSAQTRPWLSLLGVPCQRPPWGVVTAIDLATRTVRWSRPLGDSSESGPLGIRSGLSWIVGTPNKGGALTTSGGLTFVGASVDAKFRAFDTISGKLLWEAKLPGGGHAVPTSYVSRGRQFVVIAAGGHNVLGSPTSDALVAYSLPVNEDGLPSK